MKYVFLIIATSMLVISMFLMIDTISPYDQTITTMHVLKKRIQLYVKTNNKLPQNLTELPEIQGFDNSIKDGWNRRITYSFDNNSGEVLLVSCGEKGDCKCKENGDCIIKKVKIKGFSLK